MPIKRCKLGFDCASMMMQPGIDAGECLNYKTCGVKHEQTEEEREAIIELIRIREEETIELIRIQEEKNKRVRREYLSRVQEVSRVSMLQAAAMMLLQRGNSQSIQSFSFGDEISLIRERLQSFETQLNQLENQYIAPDECIAHTYIVKRPIGNFEYNKLTAKTAIFEPSEKEDKVRAIHLSHHDDARNLEGRAGIERRNKLNQAKTQLQLAQNSLTVALELISHLDIVDLPEFTRIQN